MLHCSVLAPIFTFADFFGHTIKSKKWHSFWYQAGPEQDQQDLRALCNRQCRGTYSNSQRKRQFLQQPSLWLYCKRGQFIGHNSPAVPALPILTVFWSRAFYLKPRVETMSRDFQYEPGFSSESVHCRVKLFQAS